MEGQTMKNIKRRIATTAAGAMIMVGALAGAAPADAATKGTYVWNPWGAPGQQCMTYTVVTYSWWENMMGLNNHTIFHGYVSNWWCGR